LKGKELSFALAQKSSHEFEKKGDSIEETPKRPEIGRYPYSLLLLCAHEHQKKRLMKWGFFAKRLTHFANG
jgi:hypothetical protein